MSNLQSTAAVSQYQLGLQAEGAYPWVGQHHNVDCGVAALAMIAQHHGLSCTYEQLRQEIHIGDRGASLMELFLAATAIGLRCQAVRVGNWQVAQLAQPFVAHLNQEHYVVVYEYGDEEVVLGDPASGVVHWSRSLFEQACSGKILLVANREKEP